MHIPPHQSILPLEDLLRHRRPQHQVLSHVLRLYCVQGIEHVPILEETHVAVELHLRGR